MTGPEEIDSILASWFLESAPATVPAEIHADVIARARSSRQHVRWSAALGEAVGRVMVRPAVRLAATAAASAAVILTVFAIAGVPSAPGPTPSESSSAPTASSASTDGPQGSPMTSRFVPPFTYTIPPGSDLRGIGGVPGAVAFVVGPNRAPTGGGSNGSFGGQNPETGNLRGVVVADVGGAWGHGPDGRVPLRSDPAEFLADLDRLTGVDLGPVTTATLDGRPALTARTVPGAVADHDLHVDGPITGLAGRYVFMRGPYRLILTELDGTTICVEIWARTEDDLAAWIPVAQEFIDSMHFVDP